MNAEVTQVDRVRPSFQWWRRMLGRAARGGLIVTSKLSLAFRKLILRVCYPGLSIGRGVIIESTVRIYVSGDGMLKIGDHSFIGAFTYLHAANGELTIGADCFIGRGGTIVASESISIGRDGLIGEYVTIRDQNHIISDKKIPYNKQGSKSGPIIIQDNVWLGAKSTVLQGVTIESGAVVGANSVVSRFVPSGTVVAGAPARPIERSDPRSVVLSQ